MTVTCADKTLPASGNSGNQAATSCGVSVAACIAVVLLLNNTKDLMMAWNEIIIQVDSPPPFMEQNAIDASCVD